MSTIAEELGTVYFQLSTVGVGALAVGVEDVRQRIFNVLNTIPGSDPFRPLFGSLAYTHTDKPLNEAIPNIKKEIFDSLNIWMPEIQVNSITHNIKGDAQLEFAVTYTLVDSDIIDSIVYSLGGAISGNTIDNAIILKAFVPAKVTNGVYSVLFVVNGEAVKPDNPAFGFATAADMLTWINTNWAAYGRWYLTADSLVLYLNNNIANTASLVVTETALLTVKALIPQILTDEFYNLAFTLNGGAVSPAFPADSFNNIGALINWIHDNWLSFGSWYLENGSGVVTINGDFTDDFTDDFAIDSITVDTYLVFQSADADSATLNFI